MAVVGSSENEQTASKPSDDTDTHAGSTIKSSCVPIIDLSCFDENVPVEQTQIEQQVKVAAQLRDACIQVGFFYIRGHGCPVNVRDEAFAAMKALFELPLEVKQQWDATQSPLYRGYNGIQTGAHSCTPQDKDALPDQKESFTIGAEVSTASTTNKAKSSSPMHGPNQWPAPQRLPEFEPAMRKYWDTLLHVVAVRLMKALAMSLQLDNDHFFLNQCDNPVAQMVLLRYPAVTTTTVTTDDNNNHQNRPRGCGAHTDCGFLTILAQQDNVAGLEVQPCNTNSNMWMPAPPIPDTFVVNLGDMAARWTNDLYQSTPHRVQSPSSSSSSLSSSSDNTNNNHNLARHSIPFFLNCNFDTWVECLPGCGEPKYPPTLAGEYIYFREIGTHVHVRLKQQ